MRRRWLVACLTLALGCSNDDEGGDQKGGKVGPAPVQSADMCLKKFALKSIYGQDDRQDWYRVTDPALRLWAGSTVALIRTDKLIPVLGANEYTVTAAPYSQVKNLCPNQRFYEQPVGAYCSGFLVAPDMIATAGHCLMSRSDCKNTAFVFDYAVLAPNAMPTVVAADNVYSCRSIVARASSNFDFAIIKLDRPVQNRLPFPIRRTGTRANDQLTLIGHPSGLPSKIADGGSILREDTYRLVADLDAFGGNSGSVVVNRATGIAEGILVSGSKDFSLVGGCNVEHLCNGDCGGEKIFPSEYLAPYLPDLPPEATTQTKIPAPLCL